MDSLCRLQYLKSEILLNMKMTGASVGDIGDVFLQSALASATREFEGLTNRNLIQATVTDELYTPIHERKLYLKNYPVTTLTTVKFWDDNDSYDTETSTNYTLRDQRYIWYPAKGKEASGLYTQFTVNDEDSVSVTYTYGYKVLNWNSLNIWSKYDADHLTDFNVPEDMEHAVGVMAALAIQDGRWDRGTLGMTSKSTMGESIVIDKFDLSNYPRVVIDAVERYRDIQAF